LEFGFKARRRRVKRGFGNAKKRFETKEEIEDAPGRREAL